MRILHIIPSLDPAAGGPPMIAAHLAAAQAKLGHDVRIITHGNPLGQALVDRALAQIPYFDGVDVTNLPPPQWRDRWWGARLRPALAEAIDAAEIVHLHSLWESILRVGADEARRLGRPYLILLNGMLDPWSLQQKALKKKLALAVAYRRMLNGAAALHLGNEDEKRLIEPLNLRVPGVIIPNGVFFEELTPLPAAGTFHEMHPAVAGRPFVLFLSRLHYKKGLNVLAEAFARLASRVEQVQLVVAGPDGGAQAAFEQQIDMLGVADRVHLVGPLYGPEKLAALVDASCFCLPSHQEGFSVAITEALACGVPVVISEGCHFPEVADAGAGFVTTLEPAAVADALEQIVTNPARRRSMARAARSLIESGYTWHRIAEQTIDAYEHALQ